MQANYFATGSNNAGSFTQKLEIIKLIAFLTQKMHKKDPEKYPDALSVLNTIFKVDLAKTEESVVSNFSVKHVLSFALLCDDLLWGTVEELPKPEGIKDAKEIVDKIITYFTDEWSPF